MRLAFSQRTALIFFLALAAVGLAQAVWWIVFMARLVDEKVRLAQRLGADPKVIASIHQQEVSQQVMVGLEGLFFLVLIISGAWLIYRALVNAEKLKFQQQNFLLAVTHELKTPLASLRLYADSLDSSKISPEKKSGIPTRMKEDVRRLEQLVENVLEAGRLEWHGYRLVRERFDLVAHLRARLEALEKHFPDKALETHLSGRDCLMVDADPAAIGRAIDAVLENCVKYNDKDTVKIDARVTADDAKVTLVIADNGIGLNAADQREIFDRFFRVGSELRRETSGTGLGLYLCRQIIRSHGGDVQAASKGRRQGTQITFTMKCAVKDENDSAGRG